MKTSDGAIISAAHSIKIKNRSSSATFELLRARVKNVIYTDDPENQTGQFVEYTIIMDGGPRDGTEHSNVPLLPALGGFNNYVETVLSQSDHNFVSPPTDRQLEYNNVQNSSYVAVLFLYGYDENPVIVGGWPHPRRTGATKADGVRMKGEYNGIQWEINKDGEITLTSLGGPRSPKGDLTNAARGESEIKIDKDGKISISRDDKTTIEIDDDELLLTRGNSRIKIDNDFIDLDDGQTLLPVDGIITGQSIDPFTGGTHIDFSIKARAKKV